MISLTLEYGATFATASRFRRDALICTKNISGDDTPTSHYRSTPSPIAYGIIIQTFTVSSTTIHLPQSSPNAPIRRRASHGYGFRDLQIPWEGISTIHPSVTIPSHPR